MRYGKLWIGLFTALFLAVAVFIWNQEPQLPQRKEQRLSVLVAADGETEEIACWQAESGEYYVFLPGYARLSQTTIRFDQSSQLSINGQRMENGMSCDGFQMDVSYPMVQSRGKLTERSTITFVRSGNMPALYIDVVSGSMENIHETKGNEESGKIRLYNAEGRLDHGGSLDALSGRGNSTWDQAKKPYNLKLSAQADLLGMGSAQKWILLANFTDHSHLRNKLVFEFADRAGLAYSPDSEWVDLYLNGEYAGLYLLCERNEIHPQRVALEKDDSFLVSMEIEKRLVNQNYPYILTETGVPLRIHHSSVEAEALLETWQAAENAILSPEGTDSVTGKSWQELIDLDSWARKYLIEEIFGSVDACALSQYFYGSGGGGKIYAGPVWDFDISMGIDIWQMATPAAFYAGRPLLRTGMDQPWFYGLYQKQEFRNWVIELYQGEFKPLLEEVLETGIDGYAGRITQAARMNQQRWQTSDALSEAEEIRAYLTERIRFLDSVWLENEAYCTVVVDIADGSNAACFAVRPGELAPALPQYTESPEILGWYHMDSDTPFDPAQPIYEDTKIYLKRIPAEAVYENTNAEEEESLSLLRLAPALLFAAMLAAVCIVGMRRNRKKEAEPIHSS